MRLFRRPAARTMTPRPPRPPADDRPLGCGWFDSSHDLRRGLHVTEIEAPGGLPPGWRLAWDGDAAPPSAR